MPYNTHHDVLSFFVFLKEQNNSAKIITTPHITTLFAIDPPTAIKLTTELHGKLREQHP